MFNPSPDCKYQNLQILDLWSWKAIRKSKRTQRPVQDVMSSLFFHLVQKCWLSFKCRLCLDKKCDTNHGVYCVTRYCCRKVCQWLRFLFGRFYSYSFTIFLLSTNFISKMSIALSIFLQGLNLCVRLDPFDIGFRKNFIFILTISHHQVIKCLFQVA